MNFNPDNWIDLVAYLIVGVPAIVAAVGVVLARQSQKTNHQDQAESVASVLFEVRNDHPTNLRDDIDGLGHAIQEGFRDVRQDVHGLREELRTERIERIEGDRRQR